MFGRGLVTPGLHAWSRYGLNQSKRRAAGYLIDLLKASRGCMLVLQCLKNAAP